MIKSEGIGQLALALSKAQGQMRGAVKDSENPYFKASYADLSSVWEAARKPLADNHLSVVQTIENEGEKIAIETMLLHESGEYIGSRIAIAPAKADAQGYGKVISYMRRYSLSAIIGGYAYDDDAEADRKETEKKKDLPPVSVKVTEKPKNTLSSPPPAETQTFQGIVADIREKSGEKNGKPWTLWGIRDGEHWYNTFSATLAEIAHEAHETGSDVLITWKPGLKDSRDLTNLVIVAAEQQEAF